MNESKDSVLRSITNDGGFRVIVASTSDTVRSIAEAQRATGKTAANLGELVTGTILVRETMSPQYRVQGILRGEGNRGSLVADAHPDGTSRGLMNRPVDMAEVGLGSGALLQMMRTLSTGQIHQGVVSLEGLRSLSEAMMHYMQTSEQVTSLIEVACTVDDQGRVAAAGGYVVQLLPELSEEMLAIMTERLTDFVPMRELLCHGTMGPAELTAELLYGMPYSVTEGTPLRFGCYCSHERMVAGLATLQKHDLEDLRHAGKDLEISCDFCRVDYRVTPGQIGELVAE